MRLNIKSGQARLGYSFSVQSA